MYIFLYIFNSIKQTAKNMKSLAKFFLLIFFFEEMNIKEELTGN